MLVLLIMLNVAYATREALSKRSDVLKVAIAESGRRSAGSAKLLLLASEAWEAGRIGEMDIGAFAAHQEPVRDAAHMALGQQALATQLRLLCTPKRGKPFCSCNSGMLSTSQFCDV